MSRFFLKTFLFYIHAIHFFINTFIKNKNSKLGFGDGIIVLNDFRIWRKYVND